MFHYCEDKAPQVDSHRLNLSKKKKKKKKTVQFNPANKSMDWDNLFSLWNNFWGIFSMTTPLVTITLLINFTAEVNTIRTTISVLVSVLYINNIIKIVALCRGYRRKTLTENRYSGLWDWFTWVIDFIFYLLFSRTPVKWTPSMPALRSRVSWSRTVEDSFPFQIPDMCDFC